LRLDHAMGTQDGASTPIATGADVNEEKVYNTKPFSSSTSMCKKASRWYGASLGGTLCNTSKT